MQWDRPDTWRQKHSVHMEWDMLTVGRHLTEVWLTVGISLWHSLEGAANTR